MRILIVHQNFPGQFKHLVPALLARGDEVVGMGMRDVKEMVAASGGEQRIKGLRYIRSTGACNTATDGHAWSRDFDSKIIRGEATLRSATRLHAEGWTPDLILAHPAWGEAMFLPNLWPDVRIALYCEMLYREEGLDSDFDPEFPRQNDGPFESARLMIRCLPQRLLWDHAAAGLSPTRFQADTYPDPMRGKISVIHDGIDTDAVAPGPGQSMKTGGGHVFNPGDEIITFVNRNLEPLRGYHRFIRALPEIQRRRPEAHTIIVGGTEVSYGAAAPSGNWRDHFLAEVRDQLDLSRVHFVGKVPYSVYLNMLKLSRAHVYLTYPFVASWSLAEALSTGTPVVASDTAPVREFVTDGDNGLLVDFFDSDALVDRTCKLLEDRALATRLGEAGRAHIVEHYDLTRVCLPRQLAWIDAVARG
ncbi:glycosyltransferase [Sphingomonas sp. AX6]|uniref:glycosyltransferase n=1 Tax=Sphingomonas sp. AX6 TaxID=2653171 RepID=UPI0012F1FA4C|nr:glycosyltransferase [Sphingomonas sp. AX6]VXC47485.1 Glycosyl transferase [Sphingomonas sp. AX6]